jgi:D-arabinose 1-dehydrogenase-like Zn-dependent alcohol dehydrogenase
MKVLVLLQNENEKVNSPTGSEIVVAQNISKLNFENETFDSIISKVSNENIFKEAFRVLKKDGKITTVSNSDLDLMIAGFIEVESSNGEFSAKKPSYDTNTSFSLKSKEKQSWKVSMDTSMDDELINEEDRKTKTFNF